MWATASASVIGTAHSRNGHICQDFSMVKAIEIGGHEYLLAFISDGAGSAPYSHIGAELACSVMLECVEKSLANRSLSEIDSPHASEWFETIKQAIHTEAEANAHSAREYACTFVGAIIGASSALFMQVGDGGIVAYTNECWGVVIWPDIEMYANMTNFVTQDDVLDCVSITATQEKINKVALFSDGLQRVVLNFTQQVPHVQFFESVFGTLEEQFVQKNKLAMACSSISKKTGIGAVLNKEGKDKQNNTRSVFDEHMSYFLNSDQINFRTDDDKSLIIAACMD